MPSEKTDRQTDKSTWWSITAYNDEIALLEDTTKWPAEVKKVYGGREMCPTTERIHFQGAVQYSRQVRFSHVKKWLPTAHIEAARQETALKTYVMKADTAVGDKTVRENITPYFPHHAVCKLLALVDVPDTGDDERMFWDQVNKLLVTHQMLSSILSNSSFKSFFLKTKRTWRKIAISEQGANSITAPPDSANEMVTESDNESASVDSNELCKCCGRDICADECPRGSGNAEWRDLISHE